ncbi:MAG: alpha/beta fold hydrolase [Cyanobacteria bacterium J06638_7]
MAGPPLPPLRQRWPWIGPDLQTLRDTLRPPRLGPDRGEALPLAVAPGEQLLALADPPACPGPRGWVVLVHGLGGSAGSTGVRRLAQCLQEAGFGVWRLNLRGAGAGRPLAPGTYAAACNRDLLPALAELRHRAGGLPLLGVGLSLGGAVLLNAAVAAPGALDAVVAVSAPLDLEACARRIDHPRNRLYRRWLLSGLVRQTLADPFGVTEAERRALTGGGRPSGIRAFDAAITAPRWGYPDGHAYYRLGSPLPLLRAGAVAAPVLLLQALDDPWVPAAAARELAASGRAGLEVLLSPRGGHNGFHGVGDAGGSWADRQVVQWLGRFPEPAAAASAGGAGC